MTRPIIATYGVAAIALAMFVNIVLGLYFAADAHVDLRAPLPPYAIRPSKELLAALHAGDKPPIPLIHLALRRPDSDTLANALLGFLVWLPFTASVLAANLQYHILCHTQLDPGLRRKTAIATFSLLISAFLWGIVDNAVFGLLMVTGIAGILLALSLWRDPCGRFIPERGTLIAVLAFMVAGTAASLTSHRLYTTYHGLVVVPFSDQNAELHILSELQQGINGTTPITADDVFDRIERLPSLNAWGSGAVLFAKNRMAAKTLVISALIYVLVFACTLLRLKVHYDMHTGFVVAYALLLYSAVGASFGLVYFNDVLSAAGRQNVLGILAESATAPQEQFDRMKDQFLRFGWSQKLELAMEDLRNTTTPRANEVVRAALAEHWSNSVIAQEQPQSVSDSDGRSKPEARLVANHTLADMFYFSFASFTTTGYGDLRPVSDSARFWSIIENIAELLFTAIFFVVALTERNPPYERAERVPATRPQAPPTSLTKTIALAFMAMLLLTRCTTMTEQPIGGNEFPASPDIFCPAPASTDELQVHVIIDDSRSMRGYFETTDSTYKKHLQALLDSLAASAHVTFYRLSETTRPIRLEDAYDRDFYDHPDTPLSTIFGFAAEGEPNESVVLVSDLQQDEKSGIQSLAEAIKAAMGVRPFVSLYGWKADYRNSGGTAGWRGWYALIMANSAEGLSLVERASGVQAESFAGPFGAIGTEHAQGPYVFKSRSFTRIGSLQWLHDETSDLQWQQAIDPRPLYMCKGSGQAVQYSAFVRLVPGSAGGLRFSGVLTTEIPLADVNDVFVTIHRFIRDRNGKVTQSTIVPTESAHVDVHRGQFMIHMPPPREGEKSTLAPLHEGEASGPAASDSPPRLQAIPLEIGYSLPIDGMKTAYLVELRTGRLNLSCPQWVKDWSTTDRREWQKTLNLQYIVKTIIEASSKDEVFLAHYLILAKAPPS
jgi:hypothetical protein